jgi:hypothetical protein
MFHNVASLGSGVAWWPWRQLGRWGLAQAHVRYKDFGPIEESIGPLPFSIVAFEFWVPLTVLRSPVLHLPTSSKTLVQRQVIWMNKLIEALENRDLILLVEMMALFLHIVPLVLALKAIRT